MCSGYYAQRRTDLLPPSPPISRQGRDIDGYIGLPLDMACGLSCISRGGIRAIGGILEWLARIAKWQLHVHGDYFRREESAPGERKLVLPDENPWKTSSSTLN